MTSNHFPPNSTVCTLGESLSIGNYRLQAISGGQYRIDGGTLFGVVPRLLWQQYFKPDSNNRILQETNCVLIDTGQKQVLIDTGYGSKLSARFCRHHEITETNPLLDNLAAIGLEPKQIDIVILSHLHFDHAGGCTQFDENGKLIPTFPEAEYYVQRQEWEIAMAQLPELKGAYELQNFEILSKTDQLCLIDNEEEILSGIILKQTGGHTIGHQSVTISQGEDKAIYAGDLCATKAHQPIPWAMSYDTHLLQTRKEKTKLFAELNTGENTWLLLDHDPTAFAIKMSK